jgi:type VI secretion system secreted protein VgrG
MPIKIAKDDNFPVRISSSLGGDLLVESLSGDDRLGRPFEYHLNLLSQNHELEFDQVVGERVAVSLKLAKGERWFHGFITDFSYAPPRDTYARYEATIRPWFWFLTQTADCRIFQEMKVLDIIKEVFSDNGMQDYEVKLSGTYRVWDYCVQYCESDFNFISRLMEQEGIYYYFKHTKTKHVMVLADAPSAHATFPQYATVHYDSQPDKDQFGDNLDFWTARQSIVPSKYASTDFNFETPKANMLSKSVVTSKHASPLGDPEIFNYPGEYAVASDGNENVKIRLQELQCQQEVLQMEGTCRGIASGYLFTLENHFREDQNKEYLVVSVSHQVNNASFISGSGQAAELYRCQAEVISSKKPFRTARRTRKPIVQGPQTAIVVGPTGEEIHTDKFGRVKVQFHWDRYGQKDADSSCWVRVSQLWAGKAWGGIQLPRINQEVIVSFMEGDPDQPIITGRVYNADFMPPYDLPDNKTQSGIKSRSSKEGSPDNFNEFRFEDKIGEELIYLQAEKDLTTLVENNEDRTTINTRKAVTGNADNNRPTETIETVQVFGQRMTDIRGNDGLSVSEGDKGRKIDIKDGSYELVVEKVDHIVTVQQGHSTTTVEAGDISWEAQAGDISTLAGGGDISTEASAGNISTKAGKGNISTKAELGKITMEAMQEIELKVGSNSIKIDQSGVTIKGMMVKVEGTITAEVKSPMTTVKGDAMLTLKGGITMIN